MTAIVKNRSSSIGLPVKIISSTMLSLTLTLALPFSAPVLAVSLANCELPDGDHDGDECITQNPAKNNGGKNPDSTITPAMVGDPVDIATGNKYSNEVDYSISGPSPLLLSRSYNSSDVGVSSFGIGWRGPFSRAIISTSYYTTDVMRDDGKVLTFSLSGSVWKADSDVNSKLVKLSAGWQYTSGLDEVEIY